MQGPRVSIYHVLFFFLVFILVKDMFNKPNPKDPAMMHNVLKEGAPYVTFFPPLLASFFAFVQLELYGPALATTCGSSQSSELRMPLEPSTQRLNKQKINTCILPHITEIQDRDHQEQDSPLHVDWIQYNLQSLFWKLQENQFHAELLCLDGWASADDICQDRPSYGVEGEGNFRLGGPGRVPRRNHHRNQESTLWQRRPRAEKKFHRRPVDVESVRQLPAESQENLWAGEYRAAGWDWQGVFWEEWSEKTEKGKEPATGPTSSVEAVCAIDLRHQFLQHQVNSGLDER